MTKQISLTAVSASLVVFSQLAGLWAAEPAVGQQLAAAEQETARQESSANNESITATQSAATNKAKQPKQAEGAIEVVQPKFTLHLSQGFSKVIRTKQPVIRVAVPSPEVVDVVPFKRNEVGVMGKSPGVTTVTIWIGTKEKSEAVQILVRVQKNATGKNRGR